MEEMGLVSMAAGVAKAGVGAIGGMASSEQEQLAAEARARTAQIQAAESDSNALMDLKRQIGNIKAIRASAGTATGSPDTDVLIGKAREVSDINRQRTQASYQNQQLQASADAGLYDDFRYLNLLGGLAQGTASVAQNWPQS